MLEALKKLDIESHLIMTEWGARNIKIETEHTVDYVKSLPFRVYEDDNLAAPVSSGSFKTDGMAVVPCSMKTLASIANGFDDSLVSRAAWGMPERTAQARTSPEGDAAVKDTNR